MELTHASFFSGAGGLDMGLERAGWRTVSFSEIDPYASAVLAQHWPDVPNLGDILRLAAGAQRVQPELGTDDAGQYDEGWRSASLWSGGFPCQDLSVAGKRRGMGSHGERADTRSGLAYAFLDLVERYRPPAILLENVPGLLSSNRGRDFFALQRRLAQLGYVGAFRVLDAQFQRVPQRRRRVFIVALDARRGFGADSAAEVLSVGSRCAGHPPTGVEAGTGAADGTPVGALRSRDWKGVGFDFEVNGQLVPSLSPGLSVAQRLDQPDLQAYVLSASPNSRGVRAPDGLAGRLDDRGELARSLLANTQGGQRTADLNVPLLTVGDQRRGDDRRLGPSPGEVVEGGDADSQRLLGAADLPLGLDSHRYRCCGNGVVSSVAEWIGLRLAATLG